MRSVDWRVGFVVLLLVIVTRGAAAQGLALDIDVEGVSRHALVFAPAPSAAALPVVLAFHGAGDTARNYSGVGLHTAWPAAITVYVEAVTRDGRGGTFQTTDGSPNNRDLRFVDVLLTELGRRYRTDARRVYATGFSNGAKFVYLLWAARPAQFRAFAPVAGMLTAPIALSQPRPVLHIAGRQDRQNDFQEQLASIELARRVNGAVPVVALLHDGGHVYPSDASGRIVAFFQAQR